ncbi:MAG: hypothetical protein AB7F28_08950 [Candidatus Margulisiibacteriota bacterium]
MNIEKIDKALLVFGKKNNLTLQKLYKDEEVRSFLFVSNQNTSVQIWIEYPFTNPIIVYLWARDNSKSPKKFESSLETLEEILEEAYTTGMSF